MRILMAAKYVPSGPLPMGGVQSWIATVREELEKRGHEVVEFGAGSRSPSGTFDLGILANMPRTGQMSVLCARSICISHGIIPDEKPGMADRTLFVSEGVARHWLPDADSISPESLNASILRQPINLDFWCPSSSIPRTKATRFSYRNSPTHCEAAAKILGLRYEHVNNASPQAARDALRRSFIVFASGRAALEAMACGTPTVIYDNRSAYQAPLLDTDMLRQMVNSYSGRGGKAHPSAEDVANAARVILSPGARPRSWVREHHDVRAVVNQILA